MGPTDHLLAILGVVGGILGVAGLLAASAAVIRSASTKANLELLRGEVVDLTASNTRLEKEAARLDGENGELRQQVDVLRELVTGRANVESLVLAIQGLEKTMVTQHASLLDALREMRAA
jgi:hypothetical protein